MLSVTLLISLSRFGLAFGAPESTVVEAMKAAAPCATLWGDGLLEVVQRDSVRVVALARCLPAPPPFKPPFDRAILVFQNDGLCLVAAYTDEMEERELLKAFTTLAGKFELKYGQSLGKRHKSWNDEGLRVGMGIWGEEGESGRLYVNYALLSALDEGLLEFGGEWSGWIDALFGE